MTDFDTLGRLAATSEVTPEDIYEARGLSDYSDASEGDLLESTRRPTLPDPELSDEAIGNLPSEESLIKIIEFEISSEAAYRRKFQYPVLPGVDSGITIGIGYDLGHNDEAAFRRDFDGAITAEAIDALAQGCGLKGVAARDVFDAVKGIAVPWEGAVRVFRRTSVPDYGRRLLRTFPNALELHSHSFGALLSLVYNRGTKLAGDRRREMAEIYDLMQAKQWGGMPEQFRLMKRIWRGNPRARGLLARRDTEARLFEIGLEEMSKPQSGAEPVTVAMLERASAQVAASDDPKLIEGDGYYYQEIEDDEAQLERADPAWNKAAWSDDERSPDYSHIPDRSLAGTVFSFGPNELELLIELNAFQPEREHGRIIFALRGAQLVRSLEDPTETPNQEDREKLVLREGKPDHRNLRCVIGVYDLESGLMHGYASSTVPNPKAIASYVAGRSPSNMMLTGCYQFEVGWHQFSKREKRIPGCLIEAGRHKAILRSKDNHTFDVGDVIYDQVAGDNLHPGKREGPFPFSSWGCLVVEGSVEPLRGGGSRENVAHTGNWAKFRRKLGLPETGTSAHGRKYGVVLLTGLEAAIAADVVARQLSSQDPAVSDQLRRLRQGSQGPLVENLRRVFNVGEGNYFDADFVSRFAAYQRKTFSAGDGIYSPALEQRIGLTIFAPGELGPIAQLEATTSRDGRDGELERLAFELGAAEKAEERSALEGVRAEDLHESIGSTVRQYGSAVLIGAGKVLMREAETSLHRYVCLNDAVGNLVNREDLRKRIDAAAATSNQALKRVLVVTLRYITPSLVPYTTLERFVDFIMDDLILAHTGGMGQAFVQRLDGGVGTLCDMWRDQIRRRYGEQSAQAVAGHPAALPVGEVAAGAMPPMQQPTAAADSKQQPAPDPAAVKAAQLIDAMQQAAAGDNPDVAGVRDNIHKLRDHLQKTGVLLTPEQHQAFLNALCDTRVMAQISGGNSRDPYQLLKSIEDAVTAEKVDPTLVSQRVDAMCELLADARIAVQPDQLEHALRKLRDKRLLDPLKQLADRVLTRSSDPRLLGTVVPHYALALIDSHQIVAGLELLHLARDNGELTAGTRSEVVGGLGRAHKQIYVNHVKTPSDALALRDSLGKQLVHAIDYYSQLYDPRNPAQNYWHGVNLIALVDRARKDRIPLQVAFDPAEMARNLIGAIEPKVAGSKDVWLAATLGEAYLAAGDLEKAAHYYFEFANHEEVEAHALNSAARQLEQVWRIEAGVEGEASILMGLKGALAQKENGHITLTANERRTIALAEAAENQGYFETNTKDGRYVPLAYLKHFVFTGMAVAAIREKPKSRFGYTPEVGDTIGTGFLVDGSAFGRSDGRSYMLTNAHVMWDTSRGGGSENGALAPDAAEICFDALDGSSTPYTCAEVIWQSNSGLHDATLIALDRVVSGVNPLKVAATETALKADEKDGTQLVVVGHPRGGPLSVSVGGSLEEITARLVDMGPRADTKDPTYLHYTVPTEPGNSGSPVLWPEGNEWQVVALHHAGFHPKSGRPKLGGKAGTNHANEGISLRCICNAVKQAGPGSGPTAPAPKPKRGWY